MSTYLFDFDGTLVDSMPTYAALMIRILEENGATYPDDIIKIITPLGFINTAIEAYDMGLPADAASSDIEMALAAISEVDGRAVSESVVSDIFSKFCVGK